MKCPKHVFGGWRVRRHLRLPCTPPMAANCATKFERTRLYFFLVLSIWCWLEYYNCGDTISSSCSRGGTSTLTGMGTINE